MLISLISFFGLVVAPIIGLVLHQSSKQSDLMFKNTPKKSV
jgi:preprotein translocase subunit SecG